jgi:transposase
MVKAAYGDQALSRSDVSRWYGRFRDGREDIEIDPRSGRPTECRNDNNVEISQLLLSKLSPFAKNASIRCEHWQGHIEKKDFS